MDLTILIPVYNAADTLPRTLESLTRIAPANRSRVQVVAVNDGSTDDSGALLGNFGLGGAFEHVQVIDKTNGGSASARNAGLRAATGDWLMFLDSDDELACDPLPHLDAAAGDTTCLIFAVELHKDGERWGRRGAPRIAADSHLDVMTAGNPFHPSSLIFRRPCVDRRFDEQLISREDWHFWLVNPRIFDRPVRRPRVTGSIIHAHGSNKSADHERAGRFRALVAESVLHESADRLTKKQKNNLDIQRQIGGIQQGRRAAPSALFRWPCGVVLWGKLVLYAVLGRHVYNFDIYR